VVIVKNTIFRYVMPCNLVDVCKVFWRSILPLSKGQRVSQANKKQAAGRPLIMWT
jgi:hypothetical protein